jgi:hypothetical protein
MASLIKYGECVMTATPNTIVTSERCSLGHSGSSCSPVVVPSFQSARNMMLLPERFIAENHELIQGMLRYLDKDLYQKLLGVPDEGGDVTGNFDKLGRSIAAYHEFMHEKTDHSFYHIVQAKKRINRNLDLSKLPHHLMGIAVPSAVASVAVYLGVVGIISVIYGVKFTSVGVGMLAAVALSLPSVASAFVVIGFAMLAGLALLALAFAVATSIEHCRLEDRLAKDILPLIAEINQSIERVNGVEGKDLGVDDQKTLGTNLGELVNGLKAQQGLIKKDLNSLRSSCYMRFFGRQDAKKKLKECLGVLDPGANKASSAG